MLLILLFLHGRIFIVLFFWNYTYVCGCNVEKIAHTNTSTGIYTQFFILFFWIHTESKEKLLWIIFSAPLSLTHLLAYTLPTTYPKNHTLPKRSVGL